MDKRVIFAVAGSGKTKTIIDILSIDKRYLIITYTNANHTSIINRIYNRFGYLPQNITVTTYYAFLYSFCYRPFLFFDFRCHGINYKSPNNRYASGIDRYIDNNHRLYSNRLSKFIIEKASALEIKKRIARYYDYLLLDEIQDFGGHDFNFLTQISDANINMLFVGDFFQHTFDTSRDGNVNSSLHEDYTAFKNRFRKMGLSVDETALIKSHRCSPTVCDFITKNIGIELYSHRLDETAITELIDTADIMDIYHNNNIVKLFFNQHYTYACYSRNWGDCKGEDQFSDVCVVLNETTQKHFKNNKLTNLASLTKNKLYVAITRSRGNVYLVSETALKKALLQK
ncbi:MAG: DNA helicase UvrD [Spirochaetae bacterium HGW-Spirochaetae-3]|jgi:DNA helicase-2/ATP-dependent DNA helicase PcrA|nr:MAG: DNA helicase UvrD [Spirochaetae bacterium HGW-Spirochaetae-3]